MTDTVENREPTKPQPGGPSPVPVLGALALLVSLIALGVAGTGPLWQDRIYGAPPEVSTPSPALQAEIGDLRAEIAALQEARSAPPALPDLTPLEMRMARIETAQTDPSPALAALGARLDTLESGQTALRERLDNQRGSEVADRTLLVVLLQLVMAWQSGQPFGTPWETAMAVAEASDPNLAALMRDAAPLLLPLRDKGLPTLTTLQARFGEVARAALQAAAPTGGSWWQQAWQNVKGLVTIRRQGDAVGAEETGPEALIARAEQLLMSGDLSRVTTLLGGLTDAPAAALQSWLAQAQARQQADALAQRMMQEVIAQLSPEPSGTTP